VRPTTDAFFFGRTGGRIRPAEAITAFRRLCSAAEIAAPPGRRAPRLYDFRHRFAVQTLFDWHRAGVDVGRQLPVLSAYLGHLAPANTYWYLEATPELFELVAARLGSFLEGQS
jgi:integrase/recombinase XerD